MLEIVIILLIISIITLFLFYHRKQKTIESSIEKKFSDQRHSKELENVKKFEYQESTIKFLTQLKKDQESKTELQLVQYREEINKILNNHKLELQLQREELELKTNLANKKSLTLGQNIIKGNLIQILTSFQILTEYDSVSLVSSVSRHASFDLIGVNNDRIDFIEVKTGSASLSPNESLVKKIIESGHVYHKVIEGRMPQLDLKVRQ